MLQVIREITMDLFTGLTVVLIFVFILSRVKILKSIMTRRNTSLLEKILLAAFFGIIGILGTYSGLPVQDAIANNRAVGPIVGGLIAGPVVGLGAGIVAGFHRYMLGGFTMATSALSTVLQGYIAGLCFSRIRYKKDRWIYALIIGFMLESMHMLLLIIFPTPMDKAIDLVELIAPPMIILNSFGVAVFVAIIDSVYHVQEKAEGTAAQLALQIANKTLPFLRKGLNTVSAKETVNIIFKMVEDLGAVAIVSYNEVLAFVGAGSDHHDTGDKIITKSTKDVIETGESKLVQKKEGIGCPFKGCPLSSKVVVPLRDNNSVVGALVLYRLTENSISPFEQELAVGLAQLFSTQIETSKGHIQAELLARAEIRALQAQINPHFLFNALNTIVYYCRKEPETARELLIYLGEFYRNNLNKLDKMVELSTEIKHVDSYIKIEQARFGDKLKMDYKISAKCRCMVPPLILQPLVENAIKHGILLKKEGGTITVSGKTLKNSVVLTVEDNGVGMTQEQVEKVLKFDSNRKNIGLCNVDSRLKSIYGSNSGLYIESQTGKGTRVIITIPLRKEEADGFTSNVS